VSAIIREPAPGEFLFPAADWTIADALARKAGSTISVCIPALNEGLTIGRMVDTLRDTLVGPDGLVDEIVVLDDRSSDDTARNATDAGARVVPIDSIHASVGIGRGKGNALWTSLLASTGDIVVWCDGDVTTLEPSWIVHLVAPLLARPELAFVKARYHRPDDAGGGGRTTELVARPLLSLIEPRLAAIAQPLAGEMAGRRTVLEDIPFVQGWGVELTLLLEIAMRHGVGAIAEVDLGERRHRHHQLEQLALQAAEVLVSGLRWAGLDPSTDVVDLIRAGGEHRELSLATRPPISSIVGCGTLPGGR
jgi:glucosyl-3-phosphoglycerate synthase